jgi:hypothetical protein
VQHIARWSPGVGFPAAVADLVEQDKQSLQSVVQKLATMQRIPQIQGLGRRLQFLTRQVSLLFSVTPATA